MQGKDGHRPKPILQTGDMDILPWASWHQWSPSGGPTSLRGPSLICSPGQAWILLRSRVHI